MEKYEYENKPFLEIENINRSNDSEMSFCHERGGIIKSMKIKGVEVLYLDNESFVNPEKKC